MQHKPKPNYGYRCETCNVVKLTRVSPTRLKCATPRYCSRFCQNKGKWSPTSLRLKRRSRRNGECVEWTGAAIDGYGVITVEERMRYVHRVAWSLVNGPIPAGMQVCHHCDNRLCFRVEHLFLGTVQDNMADKMRKGRQARGETSGKATLTEAQVLEIRARRAAGESFKSLTEAYGRSLSCIEGIIYRASWKHI